MPIRVLIVDDHKIMRDGIKAILKPAVDLEVVGETDSGVDAVQLVRKLRPDSRGRVDSAQLVGTMLNPACALRSARLR